MRLQLASDLHLHSLSGRFAGERLVAPARDIDALVLAGDIANGLEAVELFGRSEVPVFYVLGNHEFYGWDVQRLLAEIRRAAVDTAVHVLDNDAVHLDGVRLLGCTLWTDYRFRSGLTQAQNMAVAERAVADHRRIASGTELFQPSHALALHEASAAWLRAELAKPFLGKTVVVTHHGPHSLSVHPRFLARESIAINAAFVSDLTPLMRHADLWLHGHVHDSFDYRIGRCRVLTNPRGYAFEQGVAASVEELHFENPRFDPALVIDVTEGAAR